jgi:hypothetical protein
MLQTAAIRTQDITPSNQLSYIFTLEMKEQRILITGDSGCYGFKKKRGDYYKDLLRPLAPLHVVQIAHHAGRNFDFYNALLAAKFGDQKDRAFLLLSHEKHAQTRPSPEFGEFIARLRRDPDNVRLLFTSIPDVAKVEDYRALINPIVPAGAGSSDEGDLQLSYQDSPSGWHVDRHAIKV